MTVTGKFGSHYQLTYETVEVKQFLCKFEKSYYLNLHDQSYYSCKYFSVRQISTVY